MKAEHREFLNSAVALACERSLFFTEVQIERLEAQVRQLQMERQKYSKEDSAVRSALSKLRKKLEFGNPAQIEAARFLEATGLRFDLKDFMTQEDRQRWYAAHGGNGSSGGSD